MSLKQTVVMLWVLTGLFLSAWPGKAAPAGDGPIVIKSKYIEGDFRDNVITFIGEVDARQDDWTIRCQRLAVFRNPSKNKSTDKETLKIEKIVAKESVVLTRRSDGAVVHCEEAVYYQSEEKMVATGNPLLIKQGRNSSQCRKVTVFLKTERMEIEGPAETIFYQ